MFSPRQIVHNSLQWFWAAIVAFVVLNVFVVFYHRTGVQIKDTTGATDYKWEPRQWKTNCVEGFSFLTMDENGYNNSRTFSKEEGIDILLMGSSQVEALSVPQRYNLASSLGELCPSYNIYSIGVSGHTTYHCVNNMKNAVRIYKPRKYLVLVVDSVCLAEASMKLVVAGEWRRIPSYDSGWLFWAQRTFPLARALYRCIYLWHRESRKTQRKGRIVVKAGNVPGPRDNMEIPSNYRDILTQFLAFGLQAFDGQECRLIVVYQPQSRIDRNGCIILEDVACKDCFEKCCMVLGIDFVDMHAEFEALYREKHILAHGFCNTAVGAGHLNSDGHGAIAKVLASRILHKSE